MKFLVLLVLTATCFCFILDGNSQEEVFSGQKSLSILLRTTGGFKGKIFLHDNPNPKSTHEEYMLFILTQSIPKKNIITLEGVDGDVKKIEKRKKGWSSGYYGEKAGEYGVRVLHSPNLWHHGHTSSIKKSKVQMLKNQDVLAVYGAGNFETVPHLDVYHPNDPYWGSDSEYEGVVYSIDEYQSVKQFFQSGHAIMATCVIEKPATLADFAKWTFSKRSKEELRKMYQSSNGEYIRHPLVARFGKLKQYGFAVLVPERVGRGPAGENYAVLTSNASAHVATFAFYLFQLWDTTAEVVKVMQETAIDIGKPGVDEEFGWGIINAHHPTIWNRAMKRLEESLEVCLPEDVALEQAVTTAKKEGLDLFHSIESGKREIGLIFRKNKTQFAFATGTATRPFGLSSRFLQQQTTVAQLGIQHFFTDNISVIGIYGRGKHEDVSVNKGSLGVGYQKHFSDDNGNLSLYVGHRSIWGTLGIPGYKAFDIAQTPFILRMVEARASFAWVF